VNNDKYKQPFCFEIKGGELNEIFIFSAKSQMDMDNWVYEIEQFRLSQEQKEKDFIYNTIHFLKFS